VPVDLPASSKPVGILYRHDMSASPLVKTALAAARDAVARITGVDA